MVSPIKQNVTAEAFDDFINRPENVDRIFELINGEIVEVPSNPYASKIAMKIGTYIGMYLLQNDIGHVTGEAGGYVIGGERFAPDVAFLTYIKQKEVAKSGYNPNPPDLAVEVISNPSSSAEQAKLRLKLTSYLASGVVVWIVNTDTKTVEVHQPNEASQHYGEEDTLDGGDILPDFKLNVKDIFPKQENN